MKNRTIPTEPFLYTYKIWDYGVNTYVFESTDLEETYDTYAESYSYQKILKRIDLSDNYRYRSKVPNYVWVRDLPRYAIHGHFGDVIQYPNRRKYKRYSNADRNIPDVRYKKGNPNKIKRGYHNEGYWKNKYPAYEKDYITGYYFRNVSTISEIRRNCADVAEYGYEMVRGAGRRRNMPNSWDDLYNSAHARLNSWKSHSKRRKQWKTKH